MQDGGQIYLLDLIWSRRLAPPRPGSRPVQKESPMPTERASLSAACYAGSGHKGEAEGRTAGGG